VTAANNCKKSRKNRKIKTNFVFEGLPRPLQLRHREKVEGVRRKEGKKGDPKAKRLLSVSNTDRLMKSEFLFSLFSKF
jgi:hypothetical protein